MDLSSVKNRQFYTNIPKHKALVAKCGTVPISDSDKDDKQKFTYATA